MAVAVLPVAPATASSVTGALTQLASPNDCLQQAGGGDCGNATGVGLAGMQTVVVSPDGKNAYAVANGDNSLVEFSRDATSGALTQLAGANACIVEHGVTNGCPTHGYGLLSPVSVAISPDGKDVYVIGFEGSSSIAGGSIAEFARNADGSLTQLTGPNNCIEETGGTGCGTITGRALDNPYYVTVSPDGMNVYVADGGSLGSQTGAVAEFSRDVSTGALTQLAGANACIENHTSTSPDCSTKGTGLVAPNRIVVSADNKNVYTAEDNSPGAIAEFSRNATTGALTQLASPNDCFGGAGASECGTNTGVGINDVYGLDVTADGTNLYAAEIDGAISELVRDPTTGAISQLGGANNCIQEHGQALGCATTGTGLGGPWDLRISPDGKNVYVANSGTSSTTGPYGVAEFARNADGSLTQLAAPNDCVDEHGTTPADCGTMTGHGLLLSEGVAISPDGSSVYLAGMNDLAEFARAGATVAAAPANTSPPSLSGTAAVGNPLSCAPGTWSGNPTYTYQWNRDGSAITGATSQTYVVQPADQGHSLTCTVIASNAAGPGTPATSSAVAVPAPAATGGAVAVPAAASAAPAAPPSVPPAARPSVSPGAPLVVGRRGVAFSARINPNGSATTMHFQYGLDSRYRSAGGAVVYDRGTPEQPVGADYSPHVVSATVAGLLPNATYHVRAVATSALGAVAGADQVFRTAADPPPPAPVLGRAFNATPVSGVVLVKLPLAASTAAFGAPAAWAAAVLGPLVKGQGFFPLTEARQLPLGSEIDARAGATKLLTASPSKNRTFSGVFRRALFKPLQSASRRQLGLSTLKILEAAFPGAPSYSQCAGLGKASAGVRGVSARPVGPQVIQLLGASAHGRFRTRGRYSAAAVRGTQWDTEDRCDGTLTTVHRGTVTVTDFRRHKNITLRAGQSYLAKAQ